MGKHGAHGSYGHHVQKYGHDWWVLCWSVDYKYPHSRLRHPRSFRRHTDTAGMSRFVKKWKLRRPLLY